MDGSSVARGGSAAHSPTSPASSRHGLGNGAPKRKRSIGAHIESSPGSGNEDEGENDKKRQPGVKRACNECRQQKVSQSRPVRRSTTAQTNHELLLAARAARAALVCFGPRDPN